MAKVLITLRVSQEEKSSWEAEAKRVGLSVSGLIRQRMEKPEIERVLSERLRKAKEITEAEKSAVLRAPVCLACDRLRRTGQPVPEVCLHG